MARSTGTKRTNWFASLNPKKSNSQDSLNGVLSIDATVPAPVTYTTTNPPISGSKNPESSKAYARFFSPLTASIKNGNVRIGKSRRTVATATQSPDLNHSRLLPMTTANTRTNVGITSIPPNTSIQKMLNGLTYHNRNATVPF